MCLGIPARIIFIKDEIATVSVGGVEYPASLKFILGATVGDYVIIHAGFAIEKVDEKEAEETIRLIYEIEQVSRDNS